MLKEERICNYCYTPLKKDIKKLDSGLNQWMICPDCGLREKLDISRDYNLAYPLVGEKKNDLREKAKTTDSFEDF